MSGSESKQKSRMSIREMEEEEMAQELMSMEMYEVGMDFEQMKEILRFINESKNMAGIEPEIRSSQEVTEYPEEIRGEEVVTKNNSLRDSLMDENSLPKPSFSYRSQSGISSPPISDRKSNSEVPPVEEMSAASPDMFETEDPKRSNTESESIFAKLCKDNERTNTERDEINENRSQTQSKANPWRLSPDNSQNSHSEETNVEPIKSRKNQRIERWKLDPTNAVIDEKDVPLQERNRPVLKEKVPYSFCHNKRVFDDNIGEKVLTVLTNALEEVADIWRRKHRADITEFQWGSPIKVGASNRSLDKRAVIEEADSPERCEIIQTNPDSAKGRNMDRNCKRKAAEHFRDLMNDQVGSDDEESIFEIPKKAKKSRLIWQPLNKKSLSRRDKIFNNIQNSDKVESASVLADYESDEFDNDDLSSLRRKNKKKDQELARSVSPDEFPRRVIPPNPSKPKATNRQRKSEEKGKGKSPLRKNTQARGGRSRNPFAKETVTLNDDEILNEMEKDDSDGGNEVESEIKPMPVKGLANKLQQGQLKLIEKKRDEERLKQAKERERLELEMEEKRQRQESQRARWLKEREEQKEQAAQERDRKAKEEMWKKNEAARDRERRRKQAEEKKRSAEAQEGVLLMDDDEEDVDSIIKNIDMRQKSLEELVQCPICNLDFAQGDIINHAAYCNQFDDTDRPGPSASPIDNDDISITNDNELFHCHVCSSFNTANGIAYEQHVNECTKRAKSRVTSPTRFDRPGSEIIEFPTSPIRCFVPISEMTDSAIDYANQFPEAYVKPNTPRRRRRR